MGMDVQVLVVGFLALLCLTADVGHTLQCYQCTSEQDGPCGSRFESNPKGATTEHIMECPETSQRCFMVSAEVLGIVVYARNCTANCMMPDADLGGFEHLTVIDLDCCDDDLCNDEVPAGKTESTDPTPTDLQCFECESDSLGSCSDEFWDSGASDVTTATCIGSCMFTVQKFGEMAYYSRTCAPTCTPFSENILGTTSTVTCCGSSFCNEGDSDLAPRPVTCYKCNSIDDVGCGDSSWDATGLETVDCSGFCSATKTTATGQEEFVRGCAPTCEPYVVPDGSISSRCCQEPHCNQGRDTGSANPPLILCYECSSSGDEECGETNFDHDMVASICQGWCKATKTFQGSAMTLTRECAETCSVAAGSQGDVDCCDYDKCLPNVDPVTVSPYRRQCYTCNSEDDDACSDEAWDPMEISGVTCYGPCQTVITKYQGTRRYQRFCSKFCSEAPSDASIEVQCCESDFCNKPMTPNEGNELNCYVCTSLLGSGCGETIDTTDLFVTTGRCTGECVSAYSRIDGEETYSRYCSDQCTQEDEDWGNFAVTSQCCSIDRCNGDFHESGPVTLGPNEVECYQCTSALSDAGCGAQFDPSADWVTTVICQGQCLINYLDYGDGPLVSRTCDPACQASSFSGFDMVSKVDCCQTSRCNTDIDVSGAGSSSEDDGDDDTTDEPEAHEVTCYTCTSRSNPSCGHDLVTGDVTTETCKGMCSVSYVKADEEDGSYTRGCLSECKEVDTHTTVYVQETKCCGTKLCNGDFDNVKDDAGGDAAKSKSCPECLLGMLLLLLVYSRT